MVAKVRDCESGGKYCQESVACDLRVADMITTSSLVLSRPGLIMASLGAPAVVVVVEVAASVEVF